MSLISTRNTLTPHALVASSTMRNTFAPISSRLLSKWSSSIEPQTERKLVIVRFKIALFKLATSYEALAASKT